MLIYRVSYLCRSKAAATAFEAHVPFPNRMRKFWHGQLNQGLLLYRKVNLSYTIIKAAFDKKAAKQTIFLIFQLTLQDLAPYMQMKHIGCWVS